MDRGSVDTVDTPDDQTQDVLNSEQEQIELPTIDQDGATTSRTTHTEPTESQELVEKPEKESPPRLPEDFYYEQEKIQAKPITTNDKVFPLNTLAM